VGVVDANPGKLLGMAEAHAPESGRRRVMVALAWGALAGIAVAWFAPWQLALLSAWEVAAFLVIFRVWTKTFRFDADDTAVWATREDDTRVGAELLLVGASLASLVGVVLAFLEANQTTHTMEILLRSSGVVTIALSWSVVHTVFALRYAHEYYTAPVGGIDFKSRTEAPDYRDFAYMAFTVGMTFQVSDTDVTAHKIRRTVLRHALLSYLFGAVILATAVNVIASLLNS
jgi:uncharacterized membrane protein